MPQATLSEMLAGGAVAIEADVTDIHYDYFPFDGHEWPIHLVDLSVVSVLSGTLGEITAPRLLLPGGPNRDGSWTEVVSTPKMTVGERVVLVGKVDEHGVLRLSSFFRSVFRRRASDGTLTNHAGGMILDIGCQRLPSLPSAPARTNDLEVSGPAAESTPVSWTSFLTTLAACQPAEVAP